MREARVPTRPIRSEASTETGGAGRRDAVRRALPRVAPALVLAGCLGFADDPARPTAGTATPTETTATASSANPPSAGAPATSTAVITRPPPPRRLVGLGAGELVGVFGAPTLKRRDPPAEVWQYVGSSCVLHIFLYADSAGVGTAVAHVEALDRGGEPKSSRVCAQRLAAKARPPARES